MTEDELISEGTELSDDQLNDASGGYIYFNGSCYEVIDYQGNVVKTLPENASWDDARHITFAMGYIPYEVDTAGLRELRKKHGAS